MKKILTIITFLFLSILSNNLYAESNGCAVVENKIESNNFEVCKEDQSFKILYELFPKFFEESVFKVSDFGDIENISKQDIHNEDQFHGFSDLLYAVFGSLTNLTYYLVAFFLLYYSFFAMLKATDSGEFMGEGKQGFMKTIIYAGIVGFLLLPIGGLTLIQMVILTLAILAISLANFVYGNYLSIFQSHMDFIDPSVDQSSQYILSEVGDLPAAVMAKTYTSDLIQMALCRDITSQLIIDKNIHDLKISTVYEKTNCSMGTESFTDAHGYIAKSSATAYKENPITPAFFNVEYVDTYNGSSKTLAQNSSVIFGLNNQKTCAEENYLSYVCGEVVTKSPKMNNSVLIKMYGIKDFINRIISISSGLQLSGNNYTVINDGWEAIKTEMLKKLEEIKADGEKEGSYKSYDEEAKELKEAADAILAESNNSGLKQVSYIYHQLILNSLTTGLAFKTKSKEKDFFHDGSQTLSSLNNVNFKALLSDWKKIVPIAKLIQENHCVLESEGLANSYQSLKKLTSNSATSGGSARCIDFKLGNYKVFGVNNSGEPTLDKELSLEQSKELTIKIIEDFKVVASEIFKRRKAVELSFLKSINIESQENAINELRKKGWLSMPTYLMQASKEIKVNNLYIKSLFTSNKFNSLQINEKKIARGINISSDRFLSYVGESNLFKHFVNIHASRNVYVDNGSLTSAKMQNAPESLFNGNFDLSDFMDVITNPIGPLKSALGLGNINEDTKLSDNTDLLEQCKKDKEMCPIPRNDPLIGLTQYGHYLMNVSINYFLIIVSLKSIVTVGKGLKNIKKQNKELKPKPKSGVKKSNKFSKVLSSLGGGASSTLDMFSGLMDITAEILASIGWLVIVLFFIGIFLAYILPLLPLLFFVVGFITWMLLIVQVLLISPIWAAHFIKFEENKEVIFKAAKNYSLQIVFKPLFMVLGMIFCWELLKVAVFFVNITVFSLFSAVSSDGMILSLIQETMFLLILVLIIYVIMKFILNMISQMSETLLKTLGAEVNSDGADQLSDMMKYYLVDKGVGLAKDTNDTVVNQKVEETILAPVNSFMKNRAEKATALEEAAELALKEQDAKALTSGKTKEDAKSIADEQVDTGQSLDDIKADEQVKQIEEEEFLNEEAVKELEQEKEKLLEQEKNNENTKDSDYIKNRLVEIEREINERTQKGEL